MPPTLGPAGSIITDPTFGSRIIRVTDEKTDPKIPGRPLMTPSGAMQNNWNANSTMFYTMNNAGRFLLFDFTPSTLRVHFRDMPTLMWRSEPHFSFTQANIIYGAGVPTTIEQYDTSTGKTKVLADASKCLSLNSNDRAVAVSVSKDDNRFSVMLGQGQDVNYVVFVYDREKGCRWYNTETGEIGGQWGPKGKATLNEHYGIHAGRLSQSGKFMIIGRGAGDPGQHTWRVWDLDSLDVKVCPAQCSGHIAIGFSHLVNPGGNHPLALVKRTWNHPESTTQLTTDLPRVAGYWYDSHLSWNNDDPDDSSPVCLSTYRPSNSGEPGVPLAVNGPWENEILCAETDGKGSKMWRFAHTYSTAKNGFYSQPRGNLSLDGRFYIFTSDWQDQLGKTPDGKYRTDVFIVELR